MPFERLNPPNHILLGGYLRRGRNDLRKAPDRDPGVRNDFCTGMKDGMRGFWASGKFHPYSEQNPTRKAPVFPGHEERSSNYHHQYRECECGHYPAAHANSIGACHAVDHLVYAECACKEYRVPPVNRPKNSEKSERYLTSIRNLFKAEYGNLPNADYRYWRGCEDPKAAASECRYCGMHAFHAQMRQVHTKLDGNCASNLVRIYKVLLKEDFCVYCEKPAHGKAHWGVPLCSPECKKGWMFDADHEYDLIEICRKYLRDEDKLLPDYRRDEKGKVIVLGSEKPKVRGQFWDAAKEAWVGYPERGEDEILVN